MSVVYISPLIRRNGESVEECSRLKKGLCSAYQLEYPVWEIDLDAVWVEDLPVEILRQSFAYKSWLILELAARSHRI